MYESWFGFREKPFNLTPDPKYLYLSPRHAEAAAHLEFGLRERGGFIVVTGEVGTGKTTLARHFLSKLGTETRSAVVLYPALTAPELLGSILDDLHVQRRGDSLKSLVDALHGFLLDCRSAGRNVVLLIDEAQDLSPEVLEQVRLLSNLETDTEKLIQIILIGQSELRLLLQRHELRQLAQRVTARYHLLPLAPEDTPGYIRHRIAVAGGEGKVTFTSQALALVQARSLGVPRLVNLICDRALLAGYVRSSRTITAEMVQQACAEVLTEPTRSFRWRHGVVGTALAVGLAVTAFVAAPRAARAPADGAGANRLAPMATGAVGPGARDDSGRPAALATAGPARASAPSTPPPNPRFDRLLQVQDRHESFVGAIVRLGEVWGGRSLSRASLRTHLDQLRALDLPAVLEMFHPARPDTSFVLLLGLRGEGALVGIGDEPPTLVPLAQIEAHWTREAVVAWPEDVDLRDDPQQQLAWARGMLSAHGYGEPELETALRRFQADAQLVADGRLGPRTRLALFARGGSPHPRLSTAGATP